MIILNCQQLFEATENPRINTITLDLLREYYETYLHPYIYQYEITEKTDGGSKTRTIELRFDQNNFCHLLGLEDIVKRNVRDASDYKSQAGWEKIKLGDIDFADLKSKNKKRFQSKKDKFVFFYLVPQLIDAPRGVLFNPDKVEGSTQITCELLFYDELQKAHVHVGIKYDADLGYYIPKTLVIERNAGTKFIDNQTEVIVTRVAKNEYEDDKN
ncbi:PBECR4 domain-containing protein [Bacillus paramycoides]|uniref:PBECR4 domain-containing protein n=1 Tax=Bacillus paramycoides TaxID=2026194 RepID=UPI002E1B8217|nr:PBECR4 domain-containing protein [Bacillus paramycoides]